MMMKQYSMMTSSGRRRKKSVREEERRRYFIPLSDDWYHDSSWWRHQSVDCLPLLSSSDRFDGSPPYESKRRTNSTLPTSAACRKGEYCPKKEKKVTFLFGKHTKFYLGYNLHRLPHRVTELPNRDGLLGWLVGAELFFASSAAIEYPHQMILIPNKETKLLKREFCVCCFCSLLRTKTVFFFFTSNLFSSKYVVFRSFFLSFVRSFFLSSLCIFHNSNMCVLWARRSFPYRSLRQPR